jgi:hypothetical protein
VIDEPAAFPEGAEVQLQHAAVQAPSRRGPSQCATSTTSRAGSASSSTR